MIDFKIFACVWGFILGLVLVAPWFFNSLSLYMSWVNGIFK